MPLPNVCGFWLQNSFKAWLLELNAADIGYFDWDRVMEAGSALGLIAEWVGFRVSGYRSCFQHMFSSETHGYSVLRPPKSKKFL